MHTRAESDTTAYTSTFTLLCQESLYLAPRAVDRLSLDSKCTQYVCDKTRSRAAGETRGSQNWQMTQATWGWSCHRSHSEALVPTHRWGLLMDRLGMWAEAKSGLCSGRKEWWEWSGACFLLKMLWISVDVVLFCRGLPLTCTSQCCVHQLIGDYRRQGF